MALPKNLVSKFAKATHDSTDNSKETITYGMIEQVKDEKNGTQYYVRINGSDILTPALITTNVNITQPVSVMIKNHKAIVTGNRVPIPSENDGLILNNTATLVIETATKEDIDQIWIDNPIN